MSVSWLIELVVDGVSFLFLVVLREMRKLCWPMFEHVKGDLVFMYLSAIHLDRSNVQHLRVISAGRLCLP